MEKDKILKGNELIARFMGWKEIDPNTEDGQFIHDNFPDLEKPSEMKYHFSYDWIMKVVEKIEDSLPEGSECIIVNTTCVIDDYANGVSFSATENTKIEAIFCAVCEYITWYNEQ